MVVPIFAYGGYYFAYFDQNRLLAEEVAKQGTINVGKVFDLNPDTELLVFDDRGTWRAEEFVENYPIPVTYSQIASARMVPASQCARIPNYRNGALAWVGNIPDYRGKFGPERAPCILTRIERPAHQPVFIRDVDHASQQLQWFGINEPSTELVVDGKVVGSLQKIIVYHIPYVLWALGCGLVDNPPSWTCFSGIYGQRENIDLDVPSTRGYPYTNPASILLGMSRYTEADIQNFAGYPVNAEIVERAQSPETPPKKSSLRTNDGGTKR